MMNQRPALLFKILFKEKRSPTLVVLSLVFSIAIIGLAWQFGTKKGEPSDMFQLGETAQLGSLQITTYDKKESFYSSLELDENYQRIRKKYLAINIKVFNPSMSETEQLIIRLKDARGQEYKVDHSVARYVPELKEFGRNMTIYPRIMQEGYVFFSGIDERAKKMQLIFTLEGKNEKVAFEVER